MCDVACQGSWPPMEAGDSWQGPGAALLGVPHRVDLCVSSKSVPAHTWGVSVSSVTEGRAATCRVGVGR